MLVETLTSLGAEVVEDPFAGSGFVELYGERPSVRTQGAYDMLLYLRQLGPNAPFNSIEEWEALSGREYTRGRRGDQEAPPPARPSATEEGDAYQAWRHEIRGLFRTVLEEMSWMDSSFRSPVFRTVRSSRIRSDRTSIRTTGLKSRATSLTTSACPR